MQLARKIATERPQKMTQVYVSYHLDYLVVHWMLTSALSALLPQKKNRSNAELVLYHFQHSSMWFPDFAFIFLQMQGLSL